MAENGQLQRFVDAQQKDYAIALAEVKAGQKRSHWMWYIFPQLAGLGYSDISRYYALRDLTEAAAYLRHPVLGLRLIQICEELISSTETNATRIFGSPDDLKLRSSMTLFAMVPGGDAVFQTVLDKFFKGGMDERTVRLVKAG
jgi:uncharacterized protein (DUF1810 family)